MKNNTLLKLEREISALKNKLKELEPHIYHNASLAIVYNRTLVEKAILVNEYKKILKHPNFAEKIKNIFNFKRKPKLICDYFQEF